MAITRPTAEFLAEARAAGVDFGRTLTIGRQATFVGPLALGRMLRRSGAWPAGQSRRDFYASFRPGPPWRLEPYLAALGAREVSAMDVSDYEGAEVIHDLNEPVPEELHERYDVVFDGGSLEHVFDVATALGNYMKMVKPGGHLIVETMANNHCGHGFYQFSPELFFRALSDENGYEVERLHVAGEEIEFSTRVPGIGVPVNLAPAGRYSVADPARVGGRVPLRGSHGANLVVQARRTRSGPIFERPPLQSDYQPMWTGDVVTAQDAPATPIRRLYRRVFPDEARMAVALDVLPRLLALADLPWRRKVAREKSFRNRRHFRRAGARGRR